MATANRLIDVLVEHIAVTNELQQALQEEQKAIIGLDTTLMNTLNSQKEMLISRHRRVADMLRSVMSETAIQLGLQTSATLSEIIEKMPDAMRSRVQPLQKSVKQVSSTVSILANQNRDMLERFLGVVNESLGFVLKIINTSDTYGARGTYLSNARTGAVMVNREA